LNSLRQLFDLPVTHPRTSYFLAIVITIILTINFRPLLIWLPIWSRRFRLGEAEKTLKSLRHLHGNSYLLGLYVLDDFVDTTWEIGLTLLALQAIAVAGHLSVRTAVWLIGANIGASIFGRSVRLRKIIRGLQNYETATQTLEARCAYLRGKLRM
jgi:hypothetical protein